VSPDGTECTDRLAAETLAKGRFCPNLDRSGAQDAGEVLMIDEGALSERDRGRLRDEQAVWLVTVTPNGEPSPTPVWFVWDGSTFLIYSQRSKPKVRNIASNPNVALHFNADHEGEQVFVLSGQAALDRSAPTILENPAYLEKYAEGIPSIGMTPETVSEEYSEPIRVEPRSFRSW
jgi:PPOX class probable F420-dependent enzyme